MADAPVAPAEDQPQSWGQEAAKYRNAGFSDAEIEDYKSTAADKYQKAGFSPQEIGEYFGAKSPDMSAVKNYVQANLASAQKAQAESAPEGGVTPGDNAQDLPVKNPVTPAKSWVEALDAGWQMSVTGLLKRGQAPDVALDKNADWKMKLAAQVGQMGGDLPPFLAAGALASETGPIGAGAAAFAMPAAMRKIMMDHYQKGDITTAKDFFQRAAETSWETIKAAGVGGVTAGSGAFVAPYVGNLAKAGVEAATNTMVGAAVEGRLPDKSDLTNAAIMVGGLHAVGYVAPKIGRIFADTGASPEEVAQEAHNNPAFKGELLSQNPELPPTQPMSPEGHLINPDFDKEMAAAKAPEEEPTPTEKQKAVQENPNLSDDQKGILSLIGEQGEPEKQSISDWFDEKYARILDRTAALRDMIKKAGVEPSPEDSAALLQQHAAVTDTVKEFIEGSGTRDFKTGDVNGEAFTDITDDYAKEFPKDAELNGLKAYGISARAVELENRGKSFEVDGKPVDMDLAKRVVEEGKSQYQPYLDRMVQFKNRTLDYMHDSGYFTDDQVKAMKDQNKAYFSFKRIQDPDEFTGSVSSGGQGVRRIVGQGGKLVDPILSTIKDTDMMIKMAKQNQIRSRFVSDISQAPDLEGLLSEVKAPMKPIQVLASELNRGLKAEGFDSDQALSEGLTIFRPRDSVLQNNQFETYENGQRRVFETSPLVAETLKNMSGDATATEAWTKVMAGFATGLRVGSVHNPAFGVAHFFRNGITASVLSQTGLRPFLDAALHAPDMFMKTDAYSQFLVDGGAVSSVAPLDSNYVENKISAINKEVPFYEKAWNFTKDAATISHWVITTTDNMNRFAEYQRSIDQGTSRVEAAYNARNVIPDYQKAGLQRSALMTMAAFAKVHLGAEAAMIKSLYYDPVGTTAKALAYITTPAVLLYAANYGDKRIDDQPNWLKDNYVTTAVDHWRPAYNLAEAKSVDEGLSRQMTDGSWQINDGPVLRMTLPFTLGIAFGRAPMVAMEAFAKKDPGIAEDWVKSLGKSMVANLMPTAVTPMFEQWTNHSIFSGRQLVSANAEKNLPEMQYQPYTSETAKQLGKLISYVPGSGSTASPIVIDNYLRDWTGTLGQVAVQTIDKGLHAAGIGNTAPQPVGTLADMPIVKAFVARYPSTSIQAVEDLYAVQSQSSKIMDSLRQAQKDGDTESISRIQSRYQDQMVDLSGYTKGLSQMNALIQGVNKDPNMDPTSKRQLIDSTLYQMMALAKDGMSKFKEFQKGVADKQNTANTQ